MPARWAGALVVLLVVSACAATGQQQAPPKALVLSQLPGWSAETATAAMPALLNGCRSLLRRGAGEPVPAVLAAPKADDWRAACATIQSIAGDSATNIAARLETVLVALSPDDRGVPALITGYYEPEFPANRSPDATHRWPVYGLPENPDQFSRADISAGALAGKGLEIAYFADPVDAFFLQIQGSGRVRLPDGTIMRLGYAGNNGREYVAIGKLLADAGLIARDDVTMQSIRAYLRDHPDNAAQWMDGNPRYVYLKEYEGPGPIGAMGEALVPMVSVATDPDHVALGTPIWLNAAWPDDGAGHKAGDPLHFLALAQDKGGAIKGSGRIDLFWGAGEMAEEMAGKMRVRGSYYPIVPSQWAASQGWIAGS